MDTSFLWSTLDLEGATIPDENKWNFIRSYRNQLLTHCDWTQLPDAPLNEEEKVMWQVYRQTLRDLPAIYETPDEVIFPTAPNGET